MIVDKTFNALLEENQRLKAKPTEIEITDDLEEGLYIGYFHSEYLSRKDRPLVFLKQKGKKLKVITYTNPSNSAIEELTTYDGYHIVKKLERENLW